MDPIEYDGAMSRRTGILVVVVLAGVAVATLVLRPGRTWPDALVMDNNGEPQSLDPSLMRGVPEHRLALALFEGLCGYDPKTLAPVPGVAERWELSDDGLTWTFHLRPARWSDGTPLTSKDFLYAFQRILSPETAADYAHMVAHHVKGGRAYHEWALAEAALGAFEKGRVPDDTRWRMLLNLAGACSDQIERMHLVRAKSDAERLKVREFKEAAGARPQPRIEELGCRAPDDRTLTIEMEHPTPYFLEMLGHYAFFPVPRHAVEKHGDRWTHPDHFVGNGPYVLKEHVAQSHILMEPNPNYWDAALLPQRQVVFAAIEQPSTAYPMYQAGDVDWLTDVPREFVRELMERPDYHSAPYAGTYFYAFDVTRPGLEKKEARRALAWAIDRRAIVEAITASGEAPAGTLVPPVYAGYAAPEGFGFDPVKARRLLVEAGYPGGQGFPPLELVYNTREAHKKIAAAIQQMWKQHLGIEVTLRNMEWGTYLDVMSKIDYQVIRRAWIGDYNDPNTFLEMFVTGGGNNNTNWSHAEYDRLVLKEAPAERDPASRAALLKRAEAIVLDEAPIVPIYFYVSHNMYRPDVRGVHDNIQDIHPLHRVRRASGAAP